MEADRDYTIQDDKGVKQVLVRSRLGGYLLNVYGNSLEDEGSKRFFESASHMIQSRDGNVVVVASDKRVVAIDLKNDKKLYDGDFTFIYYIMLSPGQNFIQIFDKYEINMGRTTVLTFPHFQKVNQFPQGASSNFVDKQGYPLIKFTSDDKLYFRYDKKAIEIYDTTHKRIGLIELGQVKMFTISKIATEKDFLLVVFFLDNKTKQGKILMYTHESLTESCYIKNIEKAEEIKVKWSPVCHDFLVELQTFVDPTGKSYYGQYGLYFFNSKDKKMTQVKTYEGPVHDFNWDPTGEKFVAISGFMPAGAVLFNNKNEPVYQFGKIHKNIVAWNPQGRFLCLAGFGNLNGQMEIWDIPLTKKIGECKSSSASMCAWSPDGRKIITAILTPRLRVDNCYKVYSYTGVLLKTFDMKHTELYDVQWRNTQNEQFKTRRGVSPGRKIPDFSKKAQQKKFWRPMGSGGGIAASIINAEMQKNQARMVNKNENFGTKQNEQKVQLLIQEDEKVKKKRKKKNKDDIQ